MNNASPCLRARKHRKVQGIAAALLPFDGDGNCIVDYRTPSHFPPQQINPGPGSVPDLNAIAELTNTPPTGLVHFFLFP